MTPFRNDEQNPFGRARAWPALPQTPLPVRRWRAAAPRRAVVLDGALVAAAGPGADTPGAAPAAAPTAQAKPEAAPFPPMAARPRRGARRRGLRLMPLLVSSALGACGLATLFVVIVRP